MFSKNIKIDLSMNGAKIATLSDFQENLTAEILPIFQSGKLSKWLKSRDLLEQATAIEAIDKNASELAQLKAICQTLGLDDDEEVLRSLLKDNADAMELDAQARRVDWVFDNEKATSSENTDSKQADISGINDAASTRIEGETQIGVEITGAIRRTPMERIRSMAAQRPEKGVLGTIVEKAAVGGWIAVELLRITQGRYK